MRPLTERLVEAILLDAWPSMATCVDFGLIGPDAQAKFGALQHGFRAEVFSTSELDAALGNGPALIALVARFDCPLVFETPYDCLGAFEEDWDEDGDDDGPREWNESDFEPDVDEAQEWHDFDPDC